MDTLAWVSICDISYILSLARSYFKPSIRGRGYLCHCQNSSKGPVTLMLGLLEAKGSAATSIGSAALSAGGRKASCTSFLSPLATASCQQKLLPREGWKGRDVHLQSWGWTSFVWRGSHQTGEHLCAFRIIFGLFRVFLDKGKHGALSSWTVFIWNSKRRSLQFWAICFHPWQHTGKKAAVSYYLQMWQILQQRLKYVAWFSCYASCSFTLNHCFSSELLISPEFWKLLNKLVFVRSNFSYNALSIFM